MSGLLVFAAAGRWFAAAFGYGRTLVDPEMIVPDFGLRAALNCVDADQLQSVDAKTLEELAVNTRRQLSRGSSITTFELDLDRDVVRAVRGRSRDIDFAEHVGGSSSLRFASDLTFGDIAARAARALELYQARTYTDRFGWVDHTRQVTDAVMTRHLDARLEAEIRVGVSPALAAPEVIDEDDFGGFRLLDADGPIVIDLRWDDYRALKTNPPSLTTLKRDHIALISEAASAPIRTWSIYRSILFEFEDEDARYVLSGGAWYAVDPDYATETRRTVESFEADALALSAAGSQEREDAYNTRLCGELGEDALLLDRKLFRATQTQDSVEFCDLLIRPNVFVHVKRKSGSSTLSHLFNQGLVAGELLQFDEGFRRAVSDALNGLPGAFANLIPDGPLNPSKYKIAFAVISPAPSTGRHFLPFFSQVSFRRAAMQLASRGYAVSLERIPVEGAVAA